MKDVFLPQTKDDYEAGNKAARHYIIPEASVRVRTSEGKRRFPPGTLFQAIPFIPQGDKYKVPPGERIGDYVSTVDIPLHSTISLDWTRSMNAPIIWESQPSLRRKIAKAESRARAVRAVLIGAAAGTAVALIETLVPVVIKWLTHLPAVIGIMVATMQATTTS